MTSYEEPAFLNLTNQDGLVNNIVTAIQPYDDGEIWFGTTAGLSRYDGEKFLPAGIKDGLRNRRIETIYREPNGVVWVATNSGLFSYDGNRLRHLTERDGLPKNHVDSIHTGRDGVIWIGTRTETVQYDGENFLPVPTAVKLPDDFQNVIYGDKSGTMWLGTYGKGVSRYDGTDFTTFTTEHGLANNTVWAIDQVSDGALWFGTAGLENTGGGVSRYDGQRFTAFTTRHGLAHDFVTAIHIGADGIVWCGTGLFLWIEGFTAEWNFGGAGVSAYDGVAWTSLDTQDGLAGDTVNAIYEDADGVLWFGTGNGITRYRRGELGPRAHIVSVTTDQTRTDLENIPAFTTGTRLTIAYDAIDFKTLPEKTTISGCHR